MLERNDIDKGIILYARFARLVNLLLLACLLLNAYGCATYHGLRAITPMVRYPGSPHTVATLQPVLEWAPSEDKEATYDVTVVEQLNDAQNHKLFNPGRTVFYREGIREIKIKIEPPLVLDTLYWWTVRARNGGKVPDWSRYDFSASYGYVHMWSKNYPFPFRTPVNENGLDDDPTPPLTESVARQASRNGS